MHGFFGSMRIVDWLAYAGCRLLPYCLAAALLPTWAVAGTKITDAGAWVPGFTDRHESLSGAPYTTAELESADGRFSAKAESRLGYNRLEVGMLNDMGLIGGVAEAKSYWRDTLTITLSSDACPEGRCTVTGGVYLAFSLFDFETSFIWFDMETYSQTLVDLNHDDNGVCYGNSMACGFADLMLFDLEFRNGEPFEVWAGMYGGVTARSGGTLGYVEAFNSAAFNYLDLPAGATVTSASGTVYPVPYTPIPIPGGLGLWAGVVALGLARWRRKVQAR